MKSLKFYLPAALLALFLSACGVQTSYIGDSLAPTHNVDVYYSAKDVKREYKVIGHITVTAEKDQNVSKDAIIAKARTVGADAVVITNLDFSGGKDSVPLNRADAIKYTN